MIAAMIAAIIAELKKRLIYLPLLSTMTGYHKDSIGDLCRSVTNSTDRRAEYSARVLLRKRFGMEENMKKYVAVMLAMSLALTLFGCGSSDKGGDTADSKAESAQTETAGQAGEEKSEDTGADAAADAQTEDTKADEAGAQTEDTKTDAADAADGEAAEGVMTHDEYVAAAIDSEVVVETYVQAKQSWWEDKATFYTQSEDGAYFIYEMPCSQEEYDKLTPGTKIKVTGYKSEWSGEVEIIDATYEILDGNYIAEPLDVTDILNAEDELITHQNEYVSFTDMTVEDAGNGEAFMYNWDNSGEDGDDLYFNVSANGETYTFTVESYLCDNTTDVYAAVKNLKIGDVVSMEGFLYWYEGVNPHITSVTVK